MTTSTPTRPAAPAEPASKTSSVRRPWWVVTRREVMVKLTDRTFVLSTLSMIALMVAGGLVGKVVGGSGHTTDHTLVVVAEAQTISEATETLITADDSGDTLTTTVVADEAAARAAVSAEEADAALVLTSAGWTLIGKVEVPSGLETAVTAAVAATVLESNAVSAGTSTSELTEGTSTTVELLETQPEWVGMEMMIGGVFAIFFYFASILFGMAIANSVLEEKQNRVVEILATAIPIRQLLYGKVLGNSILAFMQIALYAVGGVALIAITGTSIGDLGWLIGPSAWFVVFFVAGFAALASIWAVLGSLASRTEDLQTNTGPITMLLMVAIVPGLFLKGVGLTIASYVPIVSAVAMPMRVLQEDAAVWEPYASLVATAFGAYLLLRFGEKVYQRAVMQGGTALSWRQALKIET